MANVINSAELSINFNVNQSGANDLGNPVFAPSLKKLLQFANGVASGQADIVWTDERTVAGSGNDDIDLAGVLTDAFGATITAAEMVGIIIVADSTNANALNVGAGSNPWFAMFMATGDGIKVFPNGVFVNFGSDASGLGAVVAGTGDILRVANPGGASCKYKIAILARTA